MNTNERARQILEESLGQGLVKDKKAEIYILKELTDSLGSNSYKEFYESNLSLMEQYDTAYGGNRKEEAVIEGNRVVEQFGSFETYDAELRKTYESLLKGINEEFGLFDVYSEALEYAEKAREKGEEITVPAHLEARLRPYDRIADMHFGEMYELYTGNDNFSEKLNNDTQWKDMRYALEKWVHLEQEMNNHDHQDYDRSISNADVYEIIERERAAGKELSMGEMYEVIHEIDDRQRVNIEDIFVNSQWEEKLAQLKERDYYQDRLESCAETTKYICDHLEEKGITLTERQQEYLSFGMMHQQIRQTFNPYDLESEANIDKLNSVIDKLAENIKSFEKENSPPQMPVGLADVLTHAQNQGLTLPQNHIEFMHKGLEEGKFDAKHLIEQVDNIAEKYKEHADWHKAIKEVAKENRMNNGIANEQKQEKTVAPKTTTPKPGDGGIDL